MAEGPWLKSLIQQTGVAVDPIGTLGLQGGRFIQCTKAAMSTYLFGKLCPVDCLSIIVIILNFIIGIFM